MNRNETLLKKTPCDVCGKQFRTLEIFSGASIRSALFPFVQKYSPHWTLEKQICLACLNRARSDFVEDSLLAEKGALTDAEVDVLAAIRNQEPISENPESLEGTITFGEGLSDKIAAVGGSWGFITFFGTVLIVWITINSYFLGTNSFDPFPYILLNLVLSCLAALQAPIIMMSQNRQAAKDRVQAQADYKTNLKAELEIRHLHIKLDELISHQWHKLLEIQQVQLDMMRDSIDAKKTK